MTSKFDELVAKLTEIFQIDKPELDFGIYKIINAKAGMIRDFLNHDLKQKVQQALADKAGAGRKALEDKIAKIEAELSSLGVAPSSSPKWVAAKAELERLAANDDSESLVYAHLLTFFSRYYDDGDFISKRRYKEGQYVIPYSGEEVKLHWANADQYYTKSGENFTNYDFKLDNGRKVHFKLVAAATAKDNVKDNDCVRAFVAWEPNEAEEDGALIEHALPDDDGATSMRPPLPDKLLEEKDGELFIYFQYKKFPKGSKKAELQAAAIQAVTDALGKDPTLLTTYNLLAQVSKDDKRTIFEKQFNRYTAKNTSDYFIHKDLRGFLTREMNSYVTNEMMNLDDISNAETFDAIAPNLRLIQAFRAIATELIGFMAQLEDFQKKLWLKKKFVVQCDWCVTISKLEEEIVSLKERKAAANAPRIAEIEALIAEAKANSAQQAEWTKWGVEADPKATDMMAVDARMIDTKFFDERFKARLLRALPDLDKQCDGLLIQADNFQALNLVQERFAQKVSSAYIDPPYNADATCILYKNGYRHSSWNSLILDRLNLGHHLMQRSGIICVTIDDYELYNLKHLLDMSFGAENFLATVPIRNNPSGRSTVAGFAICHEYGLFYACDSKCSEIARSEHSAEQKARYDCVDEEGRPFEWENLRKSSAGSYRQDRPKQFYPIYYSRSKDSVRVPKCEWNASTGSYDINDSLVDDEIELLPIDGQGRERVWSFGIDRVRGESEGIDIREKDGKIELYKKKYLQEKGIMPRTWWDKAEYSARDNGSRAIANFFGSNRSFDFPKAVEAVKDSLHVASIGTNGLALDYFGGSGTTAHAVISLNRADGGHRKYILVEMGDHFDTVLKPRIEKVVYSPEWKDGKAVTSTRGISHCFKYLTLESYEDTLNNLKLEAPQGAELGIGKNDYMMNYMLDIESRASLLSVNRLRHPFEYTLDLAVDSSGATAPHTVDLVETFNYLVGLTVETEDRHVDKGYVLVSGTLPGGEDAIILWRDCDKVDNAKLREILKKQAINPRAQGFVLYVNGDHDLPNSVKGEDGEEKTIKVASIDATFLERMFAED